MIRTLYAKLALGLVVLIAAMGLVYALVSFSATRHYLAEVHQQLNRDLARNLVADRDLVAEGRINEPALKSMFHDYMLINPSIEIYLLDIDGRILSYSAEPGQVKRKHVSLQPIRAFLSDSANFPLLGDDPRSHDRRKVFSVTPVPSAESPQGFLYVVLRGEMYDFFDEFAAGSYFARLSAWAVAATLAFGLLAGLVVFRLLTRRLQRLTTAMDTFRLSDFSEPAHYQKTPALAAPDEVDRLGVTFDQMAGRIVEQIQELKHQDALRRDLVAQVSHDLRTPLAALHGYLETLKLKEDTLTAKQRADYFAIVLRQSEHLTRLVAELFELAKLEAREASPHCEPFSLPELVQDVVQKFQLKADQSKITLAMELDADLPLVSADIALVERVLDNLIDNALTHTPAGGTVRVPVRRDVQQVILCVADTGKGIRAGDLPRIFDRFYQAANQESSNGHAGLGLAIAQRIVELHGSELEVRSRPGEGTTFAFGLPVWNAP
jgi:two-component system OmpR family sensor kinase